ncbi:MAG: Twin-arginine translocation protein TatA [Frankiales bacterium]|nr:Twin-arginine translocation protein TatA [Frankiales bacterium]
MLEFFEKGPVLIVLLVGIVIFGSSRLPGAARSLGQSMRILKAEAKGLKDDDKDDKDGKESKDGPAPAPKQLPESSADQT